MTDRVEDPLAELARLIGQTDPFSERSSNNLNLDNCARAVEFEIAVLVAKTHPCNVEAVYDGILKSKTQRVLDDAVGVPPGLRILRYIEEQEDS